MRLEGHVALMGETRNHTEPYSQTMKTRSHLGDPDVGERTNPILFYILKYNVWWHHRLYPYSVTYRQSERYNEHTSCKRGGQEVFWWSERVFYVCEGSCLELINYCFYYNKSLLRPEPSPGKTCLCYLLGNRVVTHVFLEKRYYLRGLRKFLRTKRSRNLKIRRENNITNWTGKPGLQKFDRLSPGDCCTAYIGNVKTCAYSHLTALYFRIQFSPSSNHIVSVQQDRQDRYNVTQARSRNRCCHRKVISTT